LTIFGNVSTAHAGHRIRVERTLNRLAHFCADVEDVRLHFVHERGRGPDPLPLVLSHGWPSTFYELVPLIPLLTDPGGHGGDPADAFDVVIPSLPGYGFSAPLEQPGSSRRIPALWAALMGEILGYRRFGAHGGSRVARRARGPWRTRCTIRPSGSLRGSSTSGAIGATAMPTS
jgi:pimeloyl-ACP methyl ester carboxylesterase